MKEKRQREILRLIAAYEIGTQEELAYRLGEAGFEATQATISRDIRELKLSKIPAENGRQKYICLRSGEPSLGDKYSRVLREGFDSMGMAENLLVIKTVSGMAMAVAAALDAMNLKEIVGTIAGDDTIMMAVRTREDTESVMRKIKEITGNAD